MHDFSYLQKEEWSAETKSLVFYDEYNSDLGQGFHSSIWTFWFPLTTPTLVSKSKLQGRLYQYLAVTKTQIQIK